MGNFLLVSDLDAYYSKFYAPILTYGKNKESPEITVMFLCQFQFRLDVQRIK